MCPAWRTGNPNDPMSAAAPSPAPDSRGTPNPAAAPAPVGAITAKANAGLRLQPDAGNASGKKVLILEDDPAFREIMTTFINENGYEVVAVDNGVAGVHE